MGLLFHLLINGWWIGVITYEPLILTSFLSGTSFRALAVFLEDGQVQMTFSSYEMEDAIVEDEAFLWWVFCQLVLGRKGSNLNGAIWTSKIPSHTRESVGATPQVSISVHLRLFVATYQVFFQTQPHLAKKTSYITTESRQLCGLPLFLGGNRLKKLGNAVLPFALKRWWFSRKFT